MLIPCVNLCLKSKHKFCARKKTSTTTTVTTNVLLISHKLLERPCHLQWDYYLLFVLNNKHKNIWMRGLKAPSTIDKVDTQLFAKKQRTTFLFQSFSFPESFQSKQLTIWEQKLSISIKMQKHVSLSSLDCHKRHFLSADWFVTTLNELSHSNWLRAP